MDRLRYLALAFATADLLFEVDPNGLIVFAVGSAQGITGGTEDDLIGCFWRELVSPRDHDLVESLFAGLEDRRAGPITVEFASDSKGRPRLANLSACRLSPQGAISCAVVLSTTTPLSARTPTDPHGYQDAASFEALAQNVLSAAATMGQDLDLALVELPGLAAALQALGPAPAASLLRRFAGALRAEAYAGAPAARLGEERFAVLRRKGQGVERIQHRLDHAICDLDGAKDLACRAQVLPVEGGVESLDRSLRALRFAVDSFTTSGVAGAAGATLNEALNQSLRNTLAQAEEFSAAVQARRFNLVFQPIVSLKTGEAEHFETLVRFHGETSPYKLIRMAEELDMILELDLAIAEQALQRLSASADSGLRLAINISGRSIMDSMFVGDLRRLIGRHEAGRRLIFEVTESAAIEDLMVANRHIQQLRGDGHLVCLDDFGAGSSSYAYLQKLHVDVVKIDGRYVRELAEEGRDSKLVRHLVNLCRDLGVTTIAEMVTNQPVEDAARAAGVDFGQGFHYGQPSAEPAFQPRTGLLASGRLTGVTQSG